MGDGTYYWHNKESFQRLWETVGEQAGSEWRHCNREHGSRLGRVQYDNNAFHGYLQNRMQRALEAYLTTNMYPLAVECSLSYA